MSDIDITDLLERITGCINNAEYDDEADTLSDAFTVIEALETQLKTVLDREADTQCRHDAKVDALEAEIERLGSVIDATALNWLALQDKHSIQWEGAIDGAMAAACAEIERLQLECQAQHDRGYYDGRQFDGAEERAKIVSWLHEAGYRQIADKIEAREYL